MNWNASLLQIEFLFEDRPAGTGGALHVAVPSCAMENARPAIVMLAFRAPPELAATEYETVPLPVPLEPPVTLIQAAPLVADQLQLDALAVTDTVPVAPLAATDREVGETEYVQVALGGP